MYMSCIVNFKDNLTRNIPYYKLLLKRSFNLPVCVRIDEHTAFAHPHEPISKICEGYQFVIAFDGELSAAEELTQKLKSLGYHFLIPGDAELALNAYIHYGKDCPRYLSGDFSFIIYDTMRRRVFAASDSRASKPIYYTDTEGEIIITSDPSSLFVHPDITPATDKDGLAALFSGNSNVFKGIYKLPPCHTLEIRCGKIEIAPYTPNTDISESEQLSCSLSKNTDCGVILTETADCELCRFVSQQKSACHEQICTYSLFDAPKSVRDCRSRHTALPIHSDALAESIRLSVLSSGFASFSDRDFALPLILSHIPKNNKIYVNRDTPMRGYLDFMLRNNIFLPAVAETLCLFDIEATQNTESFSTSLGDRFGINLTLCAPSETKENTQLLPMLRRILLEILADDSSPVCAFLDRGALLKLCEGRLNVSGISQSALLAHIIKLNYWFLEFAPRIV